MVCKFINTISTAQSFSWPLLAIDHTEFPPSGYKTSLLKVTILLLSNQTCLLPSLLRKLRKPTSLWASCPTYLRMYIQPFLNFRFSTLDEGLEQGQPSQLSFQPNSFPSVFLFCIFTKSHLFWNILPLAFVLVSLVVQALPPILI